jgi:hypothetical protein
MIWLSRSTCATIKLHKNASEAVWPREIALSSHQSFQTRASRSRTRLGAEFPVNRELTGNFQKKLAAAREFARQNAAKSVSCRTIPYKMKQGINSRRTGNLLTRAGNLQRLAGKCPLGESQLSS